MTTTVEGVRVAEHAAPAAFADFYRECYPDLAGYAWSLTRDRHAGDELAQEAMTRAYARWGTMREPRPYVFRIVTNLARNAWNDAQSQQRLLSQLPVEHAPSPNAELLDAVRRLPERLRETVLLHYFADLPIEQVARALRRPTGTVKRRLFEARALLADALQER